jgi:hypothetical protein
MNENEWKLLGMNIEKFFDTKTYDEDPEDYINDKYILYFEGKWKQIYKVVLYQEEGMCFSGWTTASYGNINIEKIDHIYPLSYFPKTGIYIDEVKESEDYIKNTVFDYSSDGGCEYYSSGYVEINMDNFTETPRVKKDRIVYIFKGDSNLGKTYLAMSTGKVIYETDSNAELPKVITADIIVMGNKHIDKFDIDDVIEKIFTTKTDSYELIICRFNE